MKKRTIIFGFLFSALLLTGCEDYLEVGEPKEQIGSPKVFNDDRMAVSALTHVYTQMRANGFFSGNRFGMGYYLGCLADELEVVNPQSSNHRLFYEGAVLAGNNGIKDVWNHTYKQLYGVNSVLEGLRESSGVSTGVNKQLRGEALAIRGILHFYLTQTFGSVPYVTATDYNINKSIEKMQVTAVMEKAVADLKEAEQLLSPEYPSVERVRINQRVVQAFLSRMYLYLQQWKLAAQYAEKVIDDPAYEMEPLEKVFLKDSKSAVWQFKPDNPGRNTLEGTEYIFTVIPAPQSRLSMELVNSFEPDDLRGVAWMNKVNGSTENYRAYKYRQRTATSASQEYSVLLRVEEMYLIMAEASAHLGNNSDFEWYLNKLRERCGLPLVGATDIITAIYVILQERRKELFCEFGHRYFDLKRTGKLDMLAASKPGWKSYFNLLPLPENELLLNPRLLPQNPGY
ncbi:RagB/SusD family nutrient uptake outer membrane protein [Sphingobacterium yanglingense]|uniref:SusD-like starch-binding protein associating with outer membrane n=1 Tax=Sphingobacterium yanglingense TaxID=1437280 RepID=A0A4R6WLK7_9SPHI|nr:RagB/SusD family nutrient uptake outer membrane protein [Sphingobacterium yanglingense]TDQ79205.1 SusD-like starch-binding protein associating with outer membrane [Sphingobacterium yanglingense]